MFAIFRLLVAVAVALACLPSGDAEATTLARNVRIGIHADKTRVVLDLSEKVSYRVFTLADPYRVVLDLPEVHWQVPAGAASRKGGLVAGLRFGLFKPGNSRVVLDLKEPGVVRSVFLLPPAPPQPYRLVIDLAASTRTAFLAKVKPPPVSAAKPPPRPTAKPRRRAGAKPVVVIDPGHGGVDPGATGIGGSLEKWVTLRMARQLRKVLNRSGRYQVALTRDRDIFIPLRGRVAFARRAGADLFISIHADSIADHSVRGGGIYTLSEKSSDKEAAALAAKENRADVIAGVNLTQHDDDVASILIELTQRETMNYSARFASALVPELRRHIRLRRKPHRFAGFRVLKAPDVPSVLVELGYLSNRRDERMLTSATELASIANSIGRAVNHYFGGLKH
ncbi:MAG: N-acetylmuramoyl-L-alanine amidase [Alphaproteobacteria bacterium]|jgi:N-acetylmuramoyl-L-alanine amidase|nr:N-acetylmuramoyl-L-alanine amidase [Alphaproteobacteria bacterium]MDP6812979.1 N-acetylmuramoyl-L-alanine amidase [Alphaproteobacteria bacterium]